jgi:hypothetical protein
LKSFGETAACRFHRAFGDVGKQVVVLARSAEHANRDRRGEQHRGERFEIEAGSSLYLRFVQPMVKTLRKRGSDTATSGPLTSREPGKLVSAVSVPEPTRRPRR